MHFVAASGLLLAAGIKAVSAQVPPFKGQVTLEPGLTVNTCMTAASNKDGAIVTIEDCTYADNQKWVFNGVAVTIFGGTKCLDVPSGNTADGVKLQIWTCANGNTNQMFFYTRNNRLAWTNKGKCVDLTAGNQASVDPEDMVDYGVDFSDDGFMDYGEENDMQTVN
ncbi:hypothetical protein H0H81_007201, partial [Sphagnurus paluster]